MNNLYRIIFFINITAFNCLNNNQYNNKANTCTCTYISHTWISDFISYTLINIYVLYYNVHVPHKGVTLSVITSVTLV